MLEPGKPDHVPRSNRSEHSNQSSISFHSESSTSSDGNDGFARPQASSQVTSALANRNTQRQKTQHGGHHRNAANENPTASSAPAAPAAAAQPHRQQKQRSSSQQRGHNNGGDAHTPRSARRSASSGAAGESEESHLTALGSRLYAVGMDRMLAKAEWASVERAKHVVREHEAMGCTFRPQLSERAAHVSRPAALHPANRASAEMMRRKVTQREREQARVEREVAGCTFRPMTLRTNAALRAREALGERSRPVHEAMYVQAKRQQQFREEVKPEVVARLEEQMKQYDRVHHNPTTVQLAAGEIEDVVLRLSLGQTRNLDSDSAGARLSAEENERRRIIDEGLTHRPKVNPMSEAINERRRGELNEPDDVFARMATRDARQAELAAAAQAALEMEEAETCRGVPRLSQRSQHLVDNGRRRKLGALYSELVQATIALRTTSSKHDASHSSERPPLPGSHVGGRRSGSAQSESSIAASEAGRHAFTPLSVDDAALVVFRVMPSKASADLLITLLDNAVEAAEGRGPRSRTPSPARAAPPSIAAAIASAAAAATVVRDPDTGIDGDGDDAHAGSGDHDEQSKQQEEKKANEETSRPPVVPPLPTASLSTGPIRIPGITGGRFQHADAFVESIMVQATSNPGAARPLFTAIATMGSNSTKKTVAEGTRADGRKGRDAAEREGQRDGQRRTLSSDGAGPRRSAADEERAVERLRRPARKDSKVERLREYLNLRDSEECTFAPQINEYKGPASSRRLAAGGAASSGRPASAQPRSSRGHRGHPHNDGEDIDGSWVRSGRPLEQGTEAWERKRKPPIQHSPLKRRHERSALQNEKQTLDDVERTPSRNAAAPRDYGYGSPSAILSESPQARSPGGRRDPRPSPYQQKMMAQGHGHHGSRGPHHEHVDPSVDTIVSDETPVRPQQRPSDRHQQQRPRQPSAQEREEQRHYYDQEAAPPRRGSSQTYPSPQPASAGQDREGHDHGVGVQPVRQGGRGSVGVASPFSNDSSLSFHPPHVLHTGRFERTDDDRPPVVARSESGHSSAQAAALPHTRQVEEVEHDNDDNNDDDDGDHDDPQRFVTGDQGAIDHERSSRLTSPSMEPRSVVDDRSMSRAPPGAAGFNDHRNDHHDSADQQHATLSTGPALSRVEPETPQSNVDGLVSSEVTGSLPTARLTGDDSDPGTASIPSAIRSALLLPSGGSDTALEADVDQHPGNPNIADVDDHNSAKPPAPATANARRRSSGGQFADALAAAQMQEHARAVVAGAGHGSRGDSRRGSLSAGTAGAGAGLESLGQQLMQQQLRESEARRVAGSQ